VENVTFLSRAESREAGEEVRVLCQRAGVVRRYDKAVGRCQVAPVGVDRRHPAVDVVGVFFYDGAVFVGYCDDVALDIGDIVIQCRGLVAHLEYFIYTCPPTVCGGLLP